MALAQARNIVSELTRCGSSTIDLIETLQAMQAWGVSVIALSGFTFDLSAPRRIDSPPT
jgi:putative DNA-invertase from lambdoid prophage Rac